jgi:hypothetical protein
MRFETRNRQPHKPDEFTVPAQFGCVQAEAVLAEVILNAIYEEVTLNCRQARGHELHDSPISVQTSEGLAVAFSPFPEQKAIGFNQRIPRTLASH